MTPALRQTFCAFGTLLKRLLEEHQTVERALCARITSAESQRERMVLRTLRSVERDTIDVVIRSIACGGEALRHTLQFVPTPPNRANALRECSAHELIDASLVERNAFALALRSLGDSQNTESVAVSLRTLAAHYEASAKRLSTASGAAWLL